MVGMGILWAEGCWQVHTKQWEHVAPLVSVVPLGLLHCNTRPCRVHSRSGCAGVFGLRLTPGARFAPLIDALFSRSASGENIPDVPRLATYAARAS